MEQPAKKFTARQMLAFLERDVILRGRMPLFSELAYRSDGPSIDAYLDMLGDGEWTSLQSGVSAWLGAKGYAIDREFKLVAKLPPPPKAPAAALPGATKDPASAHGAKKKAPQLPRRRSLLQAGEIVEHDWSKLKVDALMDECRRSIDRRFPPLATGGQNMVGHKLVSALTGMLTGQAIKFEDGRNLVRTLLCLLFPEAAQNQLSVSPLFWREDPLGGLISLANAHLYGDRALFTVAEAVERLGIDYSEMADRLGHNELTLVFSKVYMLSRDEVNAFHERRRASSGPT